MMWTLKNKSGPIMIKYLPLNRKKRRWNMNKVHGILLFLLGFIPIFVFRDGTFALFTTVMGISLYLTKHNRN